jgi:hypothetical protein
MTTQSATTAPASNAAIARGRLHGVRDEGQGGHRGAYR